LNDAMWKWVKKAARADTVARSFCLAVEVDRAGSFRLQVIAQTHREPLSDQQNFLNMTNAVTSHCYLRRGEIPKSS
jgi:hypothetical protein